MTPIDYSISISDLEYFLYRVPLKEPRRNAFGVQTSRPALLVKLSDKDGHSGLGEVFANWPPPGAEHRARLIRDVFTSLIADKDYSHPMSLWNELTEATKLLALQCDEPGPFAQIIAGIDIAAWDLVARRAKQPLWRLLADREAPHPLPVYASGLTGGQITEIGLSLAEQGIRGFKLKVGFGRDEDIDALKELRRHAGPEAIVMVDANQVWTVAEALEMSKAMAAFELTWLEEPLAADANLKDWVRLKNECSIPLAGGENIRGEGQFTTALEYLTFIQPDVIKWGGVSMVGKIALQTVKAGKVFCPHYLGSAVGLMASAHVLAAVGGGWLEYDANPNPLRSNLVNPGPTVANGEFILPTGPGLGVELDFDTIEKWRISVP